jgi:hypothetical protein
MFRKCTVLFLLLSVVLAASGCGKVSLGPVGLQAENILTAVRDLKGAYERRDIDAFMDKVSMAYPDREDFQRKVEKIFSTYQTIRLKLHDNKMMVLVQDKGNIKPTFTWEGEWKTSGGRIVKDGARITLVLDPGVYKLLNIEGTNMFVPSEISLVPAQK